MTVVCRLCKEKQAKNALTGEGARLYGGRWNHKGVPVVYFSGSLSLAALEMFVHLGLTEVRFPFVCIRATIPDDIEVEEITAATLSEGWRDEPAPESTKEIGSRWFKERRTPVLRVPSVIVPSEFNYLLNPEHPDIGKIVVAAPGQFCFDPRMCK